MSAKWGIPAVALVAFAAFGAAQPSNPPPSFSVPPPPSGGPSILEPKPSQPGGPTGPGQRPLLPRSVNVALKVERDGRLTVTENVFVQARSTMTRRAPLRIQAGDDRDRVFGVRDVKTTGNASAEVTSNELVLRLGEGASTVTYTVDGAMVDFGDHQEARWQVASGWDVELQLLRASFIAPHPPDSLTCFAGEFGSTTPCESAQTDHGQVLRVVQPHLKPGNRIDLSVNLPAGTVPANARFDSASTKVSAFAVTPVSGIGLGVLIVLVLGGFLVLWLARGRDAKALATDVGPVDVLVRDGNRVAFASPDGVLPGQIGTVVDERVDPADLAATVIDLAVRNYLWITETSPQDWVLVRRNPPDDALTGYERAVLGALLPDGRDRVSLSELSTVDLRLARDALYTDVVARKWFTHRPDRERSRWAMIGAGVLVAGIATTVVLALTIGYALIGIAVVIGGIALILGARWMPARTRRGSVLVQQVRGLRTFLRTAEPRSIPDSDRDMIVSRSLPYAIVFGETESWLRKFATSGLYWYDGPVANVPRFLAALQRALTGPHG